MARFDGVFRDCKQTNQEHERFVRKNSMLADAEKPIQGRSNSGHAITKRTCLNCSVKKTCPKFKRTLVKGSASIGGDSENELYVACIKWKDTMNSSDPKKIKALMRQFTRQM
jgi:hypothetical protein